MVGGLELGAQLREVLDDAVVHERDPACAAAVRVGVDVVRRPWVAQRVWPMPVVAAGSGGSAIAFSRLASLPARLSDAIMPPVDTSAIPAES